jgi:hypothetical protein
MSDWRKKAVPRHGEHRHQSGGDFLPARAPHRDDRLLRGVLDGPVDSVAGHQGGDVPTGVDWGESAPARATLDDEGELS